jgi:carboxypeptidase C (cathepsin A)
MRERVDWLLARAPAHSTGSVLLGGQRLDYTTQVAFLPVVAEGFEGAHGEPLAAVMATSYTLGGAAGHVRPVCFAFNGGPGLGIDLAAPGRAGPQAAADARTTPACRRRPTPCVDNPQSWFEHFDLVFIDPPHTGWSVCCQRGGAQEDALGGWRRGRAGRSGARLAHAPPALVLAGLPGGRELRHHARRGLADKLLNAGVALSGLILVSCAMDLQSLSFDPGNDLPYALYLPAFANVSQFHGCSRGHWLLLGRGARRGRSLRGRRLCRGRCWPARA